MENSAGHQSISRSDEEKRKGKKRKGKIRGRKT
jgi:hypothetical protein